jgi:hypothetical protein
MGKDKRDLIGVVYYRISVPGEQYPMPQIYCNPKLRAATYALILIPNMYKAVYCFDTVVRHFGLSVKV